MSNFDLFINAKTLKMIKAMPHIKNLKLSSPPKLLAMGFRINGEMNIPILEAPFINEIAFALIAGATAEEAINIAVGINIDKPVPTSIPAINTLATEPSRLTRSFQTFLYRTINNTSNSSCRRH